jgi:hypothetical protein
MPEFLPEEGSDVGGHDPVVRITMVIKPKLDTIQWYVVRKHISKEFMALPLCVNSARIFPWAQPTQMDGEKRKSVKLSRVAEFSGRIPHLHSFLANTALLLSSAFLGRLDQNLSSPALTFW